MEALVFIAAYWWVWILGVAGSLLFVLKSFLGFDTSDNTVRMMIFGMMFFWIFMVLAVASVVLNFIQFAKHI